MAVKLEQDGQKPDQLAAEDWSEHRLCDQVRLALRAYFAKLEKIEDTTNLHALVIGEVERPLFETVLEHCGHNQSKAAQILGISRGTLRKKMIQYRID